MPSHQNDTVPEDCVAGFCGWVREPEYRGTFGIILSSFLVLLTCTWTVLHLNPPAPNETSLTTWLRKSRWAVLAVFAPELITLFAGCQWSSAQSTIASMQALGATQWTLIHGFYADGGAFLLHSPDMPPFPINTRAIHYLVERKYLELPTLTRDDIMDRSKTNKFSMGMAIVQTSWMIAQCITRLVQSRHVIPLELVTVAFAICTIASFLFWMNKPLDVAEHSRLRTSTTIAEILQNAGHVAHQPYVDTPMDFVQGCGVQQESGAWGRRSYFKTFGGLQERPIQRIPDDYTPPPATIRLAFPLWMLSMIHCGIHVAGWNFPFPTAMELYLWRTASATMLAILVVWGFLEVLAVKPGFDFTMSVSTSSRPEHNAFRYTISPGKLVMTPVGSTFRMLRKIYHTLLSPQQSASFQTYQDQESRVLLRNLLDNPNDFLKATEKFALSVIFSAVYGIRLASLEHPIIVEFYEIWETLLRYFLPGTCPFDIFPILLRLPTWLQPWHCLADRLTKREAVLHHKFLKHLKSEIYGGSAPECFGNTLIQLQDDKTVDDEESMNILAMLIGAGSDTTSSVLQTFFKVMALHPEAVSMAQAELDRVVGADRLPSWHDESQLPYLRGLIKELHRWAPIGSLGVPHATTEEITYREWVIPKGAILFPNLPALSKNRGRYAEPEIFQPLRFMEDELHAAASALDQDWMKRDHFHYGFGRRLCQGIYVAESSLYITIARILWGYDIKKRPECHLSMRDKTGGLVTKPKPFTVSIAVRGSVFETTIRREVAESKMSLESLEEIRL
ncbi:uncharacterized protein PV07_10388 [Cladophialophora immunda]|uniref:Cytochrome P450 n=1 Tax=Cladophialophora immunda TaxID=569365 RepID=A0A0D2AIG3_9EURO|nr:uncharacterized protein PV07_10388 [Cladophialophora immunda]KIW24687.1 hypothetical protein PV07_10388 [Cladophialophora immunda]